MCGIIAVVNPDGLKNKDLDHFIRMLWLSESRGDMATGVGRHGGLIWKMPLSSPVAISSNAKDNNDVRLLNFIRGAKGDPFILGHTRHATQGSPKDNRNNHPIRVVGHEAILVHNGVVGTDKFEYSADRTDTYVIAHAIANSWTPRDFPASVRAAYGLFWGSASIFAVYKGVFVAVSSGYNNLDYGILKDTGATAFASTQPILNDYIKDHVAEVKSMKDDDMVAFQGGAWAWGRVRKLSAPASTYSYDWRDRSWGDIFGFGSTPIGGRGSVPPTRPFVVYKRKGGPSERRDLVRDWRDITPDFDSDSPTKREEKKALLDRIRERGVASSPAHPALPIMLFTEVETKVKAILGASQLPQSMAPVEVKLGGMPLQPTAGGFIVATGTGSYHETARLMERFMGEENWRRLKDAMAAGGMTRSYNIPEVSKNIDVIEMGGERRKIHDEERRNLMVHIWNKALVPFFQQVERSREVSAQGDRSHATAVRKGRGREEPELPGSYWRNLRSRRGRGVAEKDKRKTGLREAIRERMRGSGYTPTDTEIDEAIREWKDDDT